MVVKTDWRWVRAKSTAVSRSIHGSIPSPLAGRGGGGNHHLYVVEIGVGEVVHHVPSTPGEVTNTFLLTSRRIRERLPWVVAFDGAWGEAVVPRIEGSCGRMFTVATWCGRVGWLRVVALGSAVVVVAMAVDVGQARRRHRRALGERRRRTTSSAPMPSGWRPRDERRRSPVPKVWSSWISDVRPSTVSLLGRSTSAATSSR